MECVDGVCRLIPKSQRMAAAAAAANDENAPPQAALPPVKVGDVPPMPLPLEPLTDGQLPAATTVQALTQEKGMVVVLGTCVGARVCVCLWMVGLAGWGLPQPSRLPPSLPSPAHHPTNQSPHP